MIELPEGTDKNSKCEVLEVLYQEEAKKTLQWEKEQRRREDMRRAYAAALKAGPWC